MTTFHRPLCSWRSDTHHGRSAGKWCLSVLVHRLLVRCQLTLRMKKLYLQHRHGIRNPAESHSLHRRRESRLSRSQGTVEDIKLIYIKAELLRVFS
ncbi:hypothetical protein FIBSPDRAFT_536832 [Athelia psychrophila]|uniref:Uncharacterized protein n=1 Tax=Athelia psychrophila TaxID=1759441 RepID=A0A166J700_9AGAM|nr:hypothetical protein FIBSPDRAFT_536832 [Fibularhizoctonia sp. CBS 109695]